MSIVISKNLWQFLADENAVNLLVLSQHSYKLFARIHVLLYYHSQASLNGTVNPFQDSIHAHSSLSILDSNFKKVRVLPAPMAHRVALSPNV